MHQDQNNARLGSQRQLLQMALGYHGKLQPDGSDVSRPGLGMRTGSPSLHADDVQGPQGYADVDAMGSPMFGNPGAHQLRRAAEEAFAAHIEDRCVALRLKGMHSRSAGAGSLASRPCLLRPQPTLVDWPCLQETPAGSLQLGHDWRQPGHGCSWTGPQQHGVLVDAQRRPWGPGGVPARRSRPPQPAGGCRHS